MKLLKQSKETDNKVRWDADVDGTPFELYIPKWRVPEPWPQVIQVSVTQSTDTPATHLSPVNARDNPLSRMQPIVVHLRLVEPCTKTIRYCPVGDKSHWETGEPYIPIAMTFERAKQLKITIDWQKW